MFWVAITLVVELAYKKQIDASSFLTCRKIGKVREMDAHAQNSLVNSPMIFQSLLLLHTKKQI
jgi:hypothetical protein